MEWFEKEYKKRFEDEQSIKGVDSGQLWKNISGAIPQKKETKKFPVWLMTFLIGLIVGTGVTFILLPKNPEIRESVTINSQSNKPIPSSKKIAIPSKENNKTIALIPNQSTATLPKTTSSTPINSAKTTSMGTEKANVQNLEPASDESKIEYSRSLNQTPNIPAKDAEKPLVHEKKDNSSSAIMSKEENGKSIRPVRNNELQQKINLKEEEFAESAAHSVAQEREESRLFLNIQDLAIPKIHLERNVQKITFDLKNIPIQPVERHPWAVQLHMGANFFDLKYRDEQNPEMLASEANNALGAMQLGNYARINLEYEMSRNWSFYGGLQIANYEHTLNTTFSGDTVVFHTPTQQMQRAIFTRRVNHHNKLSTITIPLGVIYHQSLNQSWSIGASIGASYSLIRSQRGKILGRNQTILVYADDSNVQFSNFLSWQLQPFLRYNISPVLALDLTAGLSQQNHRSAAPQDLGQSARIYSLGIGMRYKW